MSLNANSEPLTSQTDHLYHYMCDLPEEVTTQPYYYNEDTFYRVQYTWAETGRYHSHTLYSDLDSARIGIENRLNRHNHHNPEYPLRVQIKKVTIATEAEEIPYS